MLDFRVGHPTHVLLGACSTDEFAREGKNGGIFTAALLQELRGPEHRTSEKDGDQYSMGNIPKRITWMDYMGLRGSASQDVPETQQEDIQKMTYCGLIRNIHRNMGPDYRYVQTAARIVRNLIRWIDLQENISVLRELSE
jgi:hypothetical protein